MPGRYRQLRMRDPDVFLLLPATSLAHRHARILRTFPVDLFSFCFTYPDLHHGLLDRLIFRAGSTKGEMCHQVAATPVGAREFLQLDGTPEPSNAEASTPSDSWVGVFDGLYLLGSSARIATGAALTPVSSGCSVRVAIETTAASAVGRSSRVAAKGAAALDLWGSIVTGAMASATLN